MFRSNKLNLAISIIAAIAIWVYVVTFVNPETTKTVRDIPVKLTNIEALTSNGLTVSPDQSFAIDVEVGGSRADLYRLEASEIVATANMTGFPVGLNTVDVEISLPEGFEVVAAHPDRVDVRVEELVSVTKPVTLNYSGEFDEGVEPGFITISPQEISVSGTRDMVDNIAAVTATIDSASLSFYTKNITAKVEAYSKTGEAVYGATFSQDEVDVKVNLCYTKVVPLMLSVVGAPAKGRLITSTDIPATIMIRGDEQSLADVNEITGRNININGIKETTIFTPDLNLLRGVELADASQGLSITVEIGGIEAKNIELTADMIEIRGLPDGYSAHVNTGNLSVTVYGSKDQIAKFKAADISSFVDFSEANLSEGIFEAMVQFEQNKNFTKVECNPPTVRVSIVKAPTANTSALTSINYYQ
jgi:YbbR domain-containing protein